MKLSKIGGTLKQRRQFLQLTQKDVAEWSGITIKTLHLIETGHGNPSLATLQRIIDVLGMEILLQVKKTD